MKPKELQQVNDEHILDLIRQESKQDLGFRYLLEKYQEKIYWNVRRYLNDHEDANDVVQNTFIKVYRNISKFKGQSGLYTWLYKISSNESLSFLRKKKRKQTSELEHETLNTLRADSYFDGDEAAMKLKAAVDDLPEKQKEVFILRYYEEMSYKEMSSLLTTSEGALKASFHHAVKKIEKALLNNDTL